MGPLIHFDHFFIRDNTEASGRMTGSAVKELDWREQSLSDLWQLLGVFH